MQDYINLRPSAESLIVCFVKYSVPFRIIFLCAGEVIRDFWKIPLCKRKIVYLFKRCEESDCSWFYYLLKFLSTMNHTSLFQKQARHLNTKCFSGV